MAYPAPLILQSAGPAHRAVPGRYALRALLLALALLAAPRGGHACSICRCGDATFNALGQAGYTTAGFRVAVDWERFDKTEGEPADEEESQVEHRLTLLAARSLGARGALFARLPYSFRRLTSSSATKGSERLHTRGLADPEVHGQFRLWASPFRGDVGQRYSLSATAGVKLPLGQDDVRVHGERADEHAQPGSGSTDLFGNLAFVALVDPQSSLFASAGYRHTGSGDAGYRYGSTAQANLAYEYKLSPRVDGVVELDLRDAARDRLDHTGTRGPDTGGTLLYATPRLLLAAGQGIVLRAGLQVPLWKDLNGRQVERIVGNAGVTWLPAL